jgi:hypothetical protein
MHLKKPFMARQIAILSMLVTILMCSSSWAASYYVDPNGNDTSGNGSSTSPWKSLSTACSKVTSSGNTIFINAGNYTDNNRCNLAVGVNIQGAGKSSVTITSAYSGGSGTGYIYRENGQTNPVPHGNNDISGFTLNGSNKTLRSGIWIRGSDNINVHDMNFTKIHTTAICFGGYGFQTDYNTLTSTQPVVYGINYTIHDVVIDDCSSETSDSTNDRQGAINLIGVQNCVIYNMTLNENYPNHGVGLKAVPGWLKGFKMYNSTITTDHTNTDSFVFEMYNFASDSEIYNNSFNHYISLNGGITSLNSGSSWNLKIHDNVSVLAGLPSTSGHEFSHNWLNVYNNYFYGGNVPAAGLWSTNYLTGSGVTHWRFNNNVVYNCSDGVYIARGNNSYVEIYNNTFDTMTGSPWGGSGIDGSSFSGSMSGTKIQNNLIINSASTPITTNGNMSGSIIDHNWLNTASPGINKTGNRPSPYYVPSSTSSNLADAGINVGLPFTGSAPAIGAFEPGLALSAPTNLSVH